MYKLKSVWIHWSLSCSLWFMSQLFLPSPLSVHTVLMSYPAFSSAHGCFSPKSLTGSSQALEGIVCAGDSWSRGVCLGVCPHPWGVICYLSFQAGTLEGRGGGKPTNIFSRLRVTCFWCLDKSWYCCRWSALLSKAMRSPVPLLMSQCPPWNQAIDGLISEICAIYSEWYSNREKPESAIGLPSEAR